MREGEEKEKIYLLKLLQLYSAYASPSPLPLPLTCRYLSDNQIEVFHEFTFNFQPFLLLDISHNRLRSFPYAVKRARPQVLKMNNNPIGNLPDDAFAGSISSGYMVANIREM